MLKRFSISEFVIALAVFFLLTCLSLNFFGKLPYVFTAVFSVILLYGSIIWGYFKQSMEDKKNTFLIFLISLFFLIQFINTGVRSPNDQARLATISSLVFQNTQETGPDIGIDKILINEKYFSNKPPVLSFFGAGIYDAIRWIGKLVGKEIGDPNSVYFWITLFLVTVPVALAASLFYKILAFTRLDTLQRFVLSFASIFGTLMLSYAGIINNHAVAASALLAGFYFLLCTKFNRSAKSALASGFFFSLAGTFDVVSFLWLALFSVLILIYQRSADLTYKRKILSKQKLFFCFIAGALVPLLFHFALNYEISNSIAHSFLPQFLDGVYDWPGSPWVAKDFDVWYVYMWNLLIGHHGLFVFMPLFFFSAIGLFFQLRKRIQAFWLEGVLVLVGILMLLVFYATYVHEWEYGGQAYGFRYLVPITPLFLFFVGPFFDAQKHPLIWPIFLIVLYYSIQVAYIGTHYYFTTANPPFWFKFPF